MGAVLALQAMGRKDIALVSFGEFDLAEAPVPAVSVVDHDPHEVGEAAIGRLLGHLSGRTRPGADISLPLELITRGSGEQSP